MLTAYDAPTASILSECGVDMILVGDSVGNALLGYESTIPVTLDDVIHHSAAVARAKPDCLIIGDMPFMSYKVSIEQALENCSLMLQEGGAEAVKIEGASPRTIEIVRAVVDSGIPVMGHIGLTPQSIFQLGGYRVQGRTAELTEAIIAQAKALEDAGVFSIVIELVPSETAKLITEAVSVPTIGIGAGPNCDGQVLVLWDMLGLFEDFKPKFVKKYANIRSVIKDAVKEYSERMIFSLSTGTSIKEISNAIEKYATPISSRLETLYWLQDNGYRTFGMICPVIPSEIDRVNILLNQVRPDKCEGIWVEAINVRGKSLVNTYKRLEEAGLYDHANELKNVMGNRKAWSNYCKKLFIKFKAEMKKKYLLHKLHFLQYVTKEDKKFFESHLEAICL